MISRLPAYPVVTGLACALLLTSCDSGGDAAPEAQAAAETNLLLDPTQLPPAPPVDPAVLEQRARIALAALVPDAQTAAMTSLRAGPSGAICGEVQALPRTREDPGTRLFLVSPAGAANLARLPGLALGDTSDIFPDLYIEFCATPEELRTLRETVARAPLTPLDDPLPAETNLTVTDAPPAPPPAAPPAPADTPKAPPPAPPRSGSFSDQVIRSPAQEQPRRWNER